VEGDAADGKGGGDGVLDVGVASGGVWVRGKMSAVGGSWAAAAAGGASRGAEGCVEVAGPPTAGVVKARARFGHAVLVKVSSLAVIAATPMILNVPVLGRRPRA